MYRSAPVSLLAMKKYSGHPPFVKKFSHPFCSSVLPVLGRLLGDAQFCVDLEQLQRQLSQTLIPSLVFDFHVRLSLLFKQSITSQSLEAYRALSNSFQLLAYCLSPTLMMGLHSVWFSSACNLFHPLHAERIKYRNSPDDC